jgi:hypothetical protein
MHLPDTSGIHAGYTRPFFSYLCPRGAIDLTSTDYRMEVRTVLHVEGYLLSLHHHGHCNRSSIFFYVQIRHENVLNESEFRRMRYTRLDVP